MLISDPFVLQLTCSVCRAFGVPDAASSHSDTMTTFQGNAKLAGIPLGHMHELGTPMLVG